MNFVLHHHFAARELGKGVGGVGAMLPDLWRMAHRRMVAREIDAIETGDASLDALLAGIAHHLEADRWFHRTEVFREGERRTAVHLRGVEGGEASRRLPLFAHVVTEMSLDGALLRREGFPAKRAELDRDIAIALAGDAVARAATHHHIDDRPWATPDARVAFDARVARLARQIAESEWIEGYQDADGLSVRLAGLRARLGFSPPGETERRAWRDALEPVVADAVPALEALLDERRRHLDRHLTLPT